MIKRIFSILLQAPNFPICGNQLIDDGEECDCGFLEDCLKNNDFCCNPADTRNECRLKPQAQCRYGF